MSKRIISVFLFLCFLLTAATLKIYRISTTEAYKELASAQKIRRVVLSHERGIIYDCNMQPLTDSSTEKAEYDFNGKSYEYTKSVRYSEHQPAAHIIGYTDDSGNGVEGIEKAFNDLLSRCGSNVCLEYSVSARGDIIEHVLPKITGQDNKNRGGVALSIDSQIQKVCDDALRSSGKSGAAVVLECESGAIRALSSYPSVDPNNVQASLNDTNDPFVNRAFSGYNLGSLFKLTVAAAALESGISPYEEYQCEGSVTIGGRAFSCFNKKAHGSVNMESALCHSCNCYFISLASRVESKTLLCYCEKFGISQPKYFADGIYSNGGNLPTDEEILNSYDLALFSFGQGKLLVTPIEAAEMINTIASGGKRYPSYLVRGKVDIDGHIYDQCNPRDPCRVMSEENASLLQKFMVSVAQSGTGRTGMPNNVWGGSKTATAETGIEVGGNSILQTWYGGFIGSQNKPKYTVVVLIEDGRSGSDTAAPVFKNIAENIKFS